jgi:hypothetical protein
VQSAAVLKEWCSLENGVQEIETRDRILPVVFVCRAPLPHLHAQPVQRVTGLTEELHLDSEAVTPNTYAVHSEKFVTSKRVSKGAAE